MRCFFPGEPGVGKTTLLQAAASAATAAGTRVVRAAGAEFEADVSFSGLNQLLLPLIEDLGRLDRSLRDALSVALGFGEGPVPDRRVVSDAMLALLGQAAETRPLLLLVDDVQWLDRPSALVLGRSWNCRRATSGAPPTRPSRASWRTSPNAARGTSPRPRRDPTRRLPGCSSRRRGGRCAAATRSAPSPPCCGPPS